MAEHVRDLLDAAAWWVSTVAPGSDELLTVSSSMQRVADIAPGTREAFALPGAVFDLRDYPLTRRAIDEAGSFFVEVGMPGNDPAEESTLALAGYPAMLAAGASDQQAGWLVEVYADPISLPMAAFEPVLRALAAVAVAGASHVVARTDAALADAASPVPTARAERR